MRVIGMRMGWMMVVPVIMSIAIMTMVMMVRVVMVVVMVMIVIMVVMIVIMAIVMVMPMTMIRISADALDMMVMPGLRQADFGFETDDLLAVFAHAAVHVVVAGEDLAHAIGEGIQYQRMIVQIVCLQELDLRMGR